MLLVSMRDGSGFHTVIDETGNTHARLFVEGFAEIRKIGVGKRPTLRAYWHCRCICGNHYVASGKDLRCGNTKSCGCLKRDTGRALGLRNKGRADYLNHDPKTGRFLKKISPQPADKDKENG